VSNPSQFSFSFRTRSGNEIVPAGPVDGRHEEYKKRPAFMPFWFGVGRRSGRFILVATVRLVACFRLEGVVRQLPRLCVLLLLVPTIARADGSLGNFRQSALREDFSVSQWQDACGPAPKSMQSGGGETVTARVEGDELVINGGGRVFRSNECYEPMPGLARDAHSRDPSGKSWRTRCSSPKNDPRRAVLQTQVTLGEGRIDMVETGKYEVTVSDGHCTAEVRRTRSYAAIAAAAEPTVPPAPKSAETIPEPPPPKPTGSCVNPGAPARVEVKPARKLVRPGESFRVRVSAFDREGCPVPADAVWNAESARARGVHVDSRGLVKIDANAPSGSSELAVTIQGKRAVVLVETASADHYDDLLRQGDLNSDGESLTGTSVVLDAQDEREVQTLDQARTRKWVFGGVIAALTVLLAALYAWLAISTKKREARARAEIEARYKEQLYAAEAKQRALLDEHAAQLEAHQQSVEAREAKVRARREREIAKANAANAAKAPMICPVCNAEFSPPFQHCPKDGAALVSESHTKGKTPISFDAATAGHGFCPVCFRGYPASVRTCPDHHEDLVPALARGAESASSTPKGKICPRCGERFDGPIAFCGKDGTALVLVM
jgi:hypothetical protein